MPGRRNRIAMNPLLRKGGAHQASKTAQRRDDDAELEELLYEWYESNNQHRSESINTIIRPGEND